MKRSIALGLYLLTARGGAHAGGVQPPRPGGPLIWLHAGKTDPAAIRQLAGQIAGDLPHLTLLVTPALPSESADNLVGTAAPDDTLAAVRPFLEHWRPDLIVLLGPDLPPALVVEAHGRAIPLIWADAVVRSREHGGGLFGSGMLRGLVARLDAILARSQPDAQSLRQIGGGDRPVSVGGQVEASATALGCVEAERASLARLLGTRSVWLAAGCTQSEEDAVLAAHAHALRLAHRTLLILVPADPARAPVLAERVERAGWTAAQRARDEEPAAEVEVLIAEDPAELGLWYRLAPFCFMGGTLAPGATARDPFEPAALGSAIIHGPETAAFAATYARLDQARATRRIRSGDALGEAVADLIAPDRAALLAHNAWVASSSGAEVAARISETIGRLLARSDARGRD